MTPYVFSWRKIVHCDGVNLCSQIVSSQLPVASHHIGVNMISAITNNGKLRYHFYRGKFNQEIFMSFLTRIIKSTDKKVFAIVDNSSTHHAKLVQAWKETNAELITIFSLPSYVPHLNPTEYLNNNFKRVLLKKGYSANETQPPCTKSTGGEWKRVQAPFVETVRG